MVLVDAEHLLGDDVDHARGVFLMVKLVKIEFDTRELLEPVVEALHVPVLVDIVAGAVLVHGIFDRAHDELGHALGIALAVENVIALGVDGLALLVHDVVIFEDVLTGGEMHGLDLALSAFDALGDHLGLNGHVIVNLGALHEPADAIHAVTAEQAHKVILEREVELR